MGLDPLTLGLALGGGGLLAQGVGGLMGMSAQQRQLQAQQRMGDVQAQNQRLDQVRQARIAQGRIIQAGTNQGAGESSSVVTGASGVIGQEESNINFIDTQHQINNSIFAAKQDEVTASGISQLGAGLEKAGSFAMGNIGALNSVFGS